MIEINIYIMIYHTILFSIFGTFLIGSRTKLSENYKSGENTISKLGNKNYNPNGWKYFSIATIILSIGLMPSITYMYSFFDFGVGMIISYTVELIGCIGVIIIALYDENTKIHLATAYITFISFVTGIMLISVIYLIKGEIHIETIIAILALLTIFFMGGILMVTKKIPVELYEWSLTISLLSFVVFISGIICV